MAFTRVPGWPLDHFAPSMCNRLNQKIQSAVGLEPTPPGYAGELPSCSTPQRNYASERERRQGPALLEPPLKSAKTKAKSSVERNDIEISQDLEYSNQVLRKRKGPPVSGQRAG